MKALLSKRYLENFDMKVLTKEVEDLFDDYNFICELTDKKMIDNKREEKPLKKGIYSIELKHVIKLEDYINYIKEFDARLEALKNSFTEDELMIFKYGIEERERDKEICDRLCKTYKTYYIIKKSCFVKIALRFNLAVDAVNSTLEKMHEIKT